jgi:16S rRNA A1518/A1519 N6-dimethyltransferase RsmA/KsgA/DIM1 with predicted DNA glycosylase/AP lyase activity
LLLKDDNKKQKELYYDAIHALFQQPRKTIENNLRSYFSTIHNKQYSQDIIKNILKKVGVSENQRPQNLSIEAIEKISELLLKAATEHTE